MKPLFKKIIYLAGIFIIIGLIFLGYTYTARTLKSFVVKTLENNFGARLSIGHMRIGFPLCLELKNVKINNAIDIAKVYVYPSPAPLFLKNTFVFSSIRIVDPVIRIKKRDSEKLAIFDSMKKDTAAVSLKDSKQLFYLARIGIENATLIYDFENGTELKFVKVNGSLTGNGIYFREDRPFIFKALGFLKNQDSDIVSPLRITGWVAKDKTIKAKLQLEDLALETLGPVYATYLKTKVLKGKFCLDSKILVSKNILSASCFCRIHDVLLKDAVRKIDTPLIASFILGFDFKDKAVKITNFQSNLLSLIFNKT